MPKFEFLPDKTKSNLQKVRAAADQAFLAYAKTEGEIKDDHWKIILDSDKGKYARTKALFAFVRDVVPDAFFHQLTKGRYEFQGEKVAIDPEQYELEEKKVGSGSESYVFKLNSLVPDQPSLVLKVDRTETENVDALVERGKQVRTEWETIKGWYQDVPGLVPDEFQYIGQSPIGGRNALFTIQEYFGTKDELHDFFRDVSRERLLTLLRQDRAFRESFITFARVTLDRADQYDEMIDTYGENNLVLVEREGRNQLILLDPHVVKHPKTAPPHEKEAFAKHLQFLRDMLAEAEAITAASQNTSPASMA